MKQASLSAFALASQTDFSYLKVQIDSSARAGHVYDYPGCLLLPGCTPSKATVGFWKDSQGYMLYVRPAVSYHGTCPAAIRLFRAGRLCFADFPALAGFLQSLTVPASVPQPLPRPEPRPAPVPSPSWERLASALAGAVVGQEAAVEAAAFRLSAHAAKKEPARPLSLILYGPTGVGKSELGKQVAPILNRFYGPSAYQFVWTELNTFTEPISVYRLTGAPPGYVGYDDAPILEAVRKNPRTVFMFDELEKAHPEVLKTFMSVLDEGRCAARKELPGGDRELDFRRCIFLFTTNSDLSGPHTPVGFSTPARREVYAPPADLAERVFQANERARRAMAQSGVLKEIAGRFSGFLEFVPLTTEARRAIIARQITALAREYGLTLARVAPALIDAVAGRAGDGAFSVRSHVSVIEGLFAPLFASYSGAHGCSGLSLDGPADAPRLSTGSRAG